MSKFTAGKWEIEGEVPFGIKSEASPRIAIVLKPEDARLIAAAPKMYRLLADAAGVISQFNLGDPLSDAINELLSVIDGKEGAEE